MYYFCVTFLLICYIYQVKGECERSRLILGAEDFCWTRKVDFGDRVQYTQKKIFNFAKKTLGMDAVEKEEPQKCEYYYCIFNEMKLINPEYDVPCIDRISRWVKRNIIYNDADILLERIQTCSGELANAMSSNFKFLASNVALPSDEKVKTSPMQNKCEISAEYMKCIVTLPKNLEVAERGDNFIEKFETDFI